MCVLGVLCLQHSTPLASGRPLAPPPQSNPIPDDPIPSQSQQTGPAGLPRPRSRSRPGASPPPGRSSRHRWVLFSPSELVACSSARAAGLPWVSSCLGPTCAGPGHLYVRSTRSLYSVETVSTRDPVAAPSPAKPCHAMACPIQHASSKDASTAQEQIACQLVSGPVCTPRGDRQGPRGYEKRARG